MMSTAFSASLFELPSRWLGHLLRLLLGVTAVCGVCPAHAEWRQIFEDDQYVYFVNDATKVDKPRPRMRVLRSFREPNMHGDQSAKLLYEAECSSGRLRMMSGVLNKGTMADGAVSGMINSQGWVEPSSRPVLTLIYELLCASSAAEGDAQMGKRISPPETAQ
ncbi:MAG: hypothetical protein EBZ75_06125 [Oxalobacteraceae bacterium]|nr:hypothetical protein [Oxalobacteraceae bacterium]